MGVEVISDHRGRVQRVVDVARRDEVALIRGVGPDARKTIGLELDPNRQRIGAGGMLGGTTALRLGAAFALAAALLIGACGRTSEATSSPGTSAPSSEIEGEDAAKLRTIAATHSCVARSGPLFLSQHRVL